jgi:protein arginine kinase activator
VTNCQVCQVREAEVHLTQIVGDEVTTLHLCGKCAAERGIATEAEAAQTPLGAFLAAMGKGAPTPATEALLACPACGATLQDFRASGRVGCAECWSTFERPLRDLVRRLHGATHHTGESYRPPGEPEQDATVAMRRERGRLREQLRQAVEAEHFEEAARLRDRLRDLGE